MFCLKIRGCRHISVKFIWCQFWCTGCAFLQWKTNMLPILMQPVRISTTQVSSVMLRSKKLKIRGGKCENWKSRRIKTKQSATKLSQIRRRIELSMTEGGNPSFWDEFIKFTFFWTVQFIFKLCLFSDAKDKMFGNQT
jgi:hypothetical protein